MWKHLLEIRSIQASWELKWTMRNHGKPETPSGFLSVSLHLSFLLSILVPSLPTFSHPRFLSPALSCSLCRPFCSAPSDNPSPPILARMKLGFALPLIPTPIPHGLCLQCLLPNIFHLQKEGTTGSAELVSLCELLLTPSQLPLEGENIRQVTAICTCCFLEGRQSRGQNPVPRKGNRTPKYTIYSHFFTWAIF